MSEHPVDPKLVERLSALLPLDPSMTEAEVEEYARATIEQLCLVSLRPGQMVVGPDTDGVLVKWGPGAYEYYYEYTADSLRKAMPGDYPCRPVYLGPIQETNND